MTRVVLLLVIAGLSACGSGAEEEPERLIRRVRFEAVSAGGGALQRVFTGVAESGEQSRLSFRVSGIINELPVNVGDRVEEGQLIAKLDEADLQLQVSEASSAAAQARAQKLQADAEFRRVQALYEAQSASRADLDAARAARDSASSSLASVGSQVRMARNQLEYATLTSPADGTVLEVHVEQSENVQAGSPVVTLQSGDQLQVRVAIPEAVINRVQRRSPVAVSFASLGDRVLEGTVFEIGTATQSATFPVTIRLSENEEGVRAGMAADVTFQFEESQAEAELLRVPGVAVGEDREGRYVYILEPGAGDEATVRRRSVTVGELTPEGLEIQDGLAEGDVIVTAGVSRLADGDVVLAPAAPGAAAAENEPSEEPGETEESQPDDDGGEAEPQ